MGVNNMPNNIQVVYVSGPMQGQRFHGLVGLYRGGQALEDRGYTPYVPGFDINAVAALKQVLSPVIPEMKLASWEQCLRNDLAVVLQQCHAVALLPGWEGSRGATFEALVACESGIPCYPIRDFLDDDEHDPYVYDQVLEAYVAKRGFVLDVS